MGTLLVVSATASVTAMAALREVDTVVRALQTGERLDLGTELAEADAGRPQTIMLIGSDKRARGAVDANIGARSDTIILVRLDPSKGATALMSLPRDLRVRIPGHGREKLNSAYSIGGSRLTLRTVKELTGLRINHVVNIDLSGFREAVDQVGCVYVDVDRRYFNDNSGAARYATIDIPAGYQRLCGQDALDYVRHRYSDNDLFRAARQQEFLRQAKQQVGVSRLFSDRAELVSIFGRYTQSDIDSRAGVLRLLRLAILSARQPVREVQFQVDQGPSDLSYLTARPRTIQRMSREFLGVKAAPRASERAKRSSRRRTKRRRARPRRVALASSAAEGREQRLEAVAANVRFPVFYPRALTPTGQFVGKPRVYGLRTPATDAAPRGRVHNAYRIVVSAGRVGEYYGVQGTTWKDAPLLRGPSETRSLGGRRFELHYDGKRLRLVAWRTSDAVYWVSNTLLQSLSEREMLAIARSTTR